MVELKTKATNKSVHSFVNSIEDKQKRKDCLEVMKIMSQCSGKRPKMWGDSIVGYGSYHYIYATGHEGDSFLTGFSPRKQNLSLYIMPGFSKYDTLMKKLGKFKTGKSCLYIKKLEDVDVIVLNKLISESVKYMQLHYKCK